MAVNEKIRIKIKGYEHAVVDAAAAKIVEAVKRSGAQVSGPIPLPTDKEIITMDWLCDNVIGEIPETLELYDSIVKTVKVSGVKNK